MPFEKSIFGRNLTEPSGILELMQDLGEAFSTRKDALMLGGGNPAQVPEIQTVWREQMTRLLENPTQLGNILANYDAPSGNPAYRQALAEFLRAQCGWDVTQDNIAITTGGQTALFFLLNNYGGRFENGRRKRILLPLMPEYIGYSSQGVDGDLFSARPARIEKTAPHRFKYHVDFDSLDVSDGVGAICVSRPTNPSANVLTDDEIQHLANLAETHEIPLIIDNAYGIPFPGAIYTDEATPFWNENVILTLSLSKLGLPGARTGIVVAREEVIRDISAMNAVVSLANNNIGQALTIQLLASGQLAQLSRNVIRPYYARRCQHAVEVFETALGDAAPWRIHEPEGAFFLWLWLEDLPISCRELYLRLKDRGVIVVPGEYFFYGMNEDWPHSHQCLRISYTQPDERVERGLQIIADEVRKVYNS